jgi:hypothetical protein
MNERVAQHHSTSRFPVVWWSHQREAHAKEIATMENLVPTLLGPVVNLTGSTCGCSACDGCTDYAKTSLEQKPAPAIE